MALVRIFESPSSHQTIRFKSRIWKYARSDIELGRRSLVRRRQSICRKEGTSPPHTPPRSPKGSRRYCWFERPSVASRWRSPAIRCLSTDQRHFREIYRSNSIRLNGFGTKNLHKTCRSQGATEACTSARRQATSTLELQVIRPRGETHG